MSIFEFGSFQNIERLQASILDDYNLFVYFKKCIHFFYIFLFFNIFFKLCIETTHNQL